MVYISAAGMALAAVDGSERLEWTPAILVFAITLAGTFGFLRLQKKNNEVWKWGWDVNPIWISRYPLSCLEMLSTASLIYFLVSLLADKFNYISIINGGFGLGGWGGIIAFRSFYFNDLEKGLSKAIIRKQSIPLWVKFFISIVILIAILASIIVFSSVGPEDGEFSNLVHTYLEDKYGQKYFSLWGIKFESANSHEGTYFAHFRYGKERGEVEADIKRSVNASFTFMPLRIKLDSEQENGDKHP